MNKIYDIQDFMVTPEEISFMIKGENIRVPLENSRINIIAKSERRAFENF